MEFTIFPFNTLDNYIYADIIAFYKGKWLLSKHKDRDTWETQGGHIESGEIPLDTAKRELYEESGAIDFKLEPLCDYKVSGIFEDRDISGNSQVFIGEIHVLGDLPQNSEMVEVKSFVNLPDNLTYVDLFNPILPLIMEYIENNKVK